MFENNIFGKILKCIRIQHLVFEYKATQKQKSQSCIRLRLCVVEYKVSQWQIFTNLYSTTHMCIRIQGVIFEYFWTLQRGVFEYTHPVFEYNWKQYNFSDLEWLQIIVFFHQTSWINGHESEEMFMEYKYPITSDQTTHNPWINTLNNFEQNSDFL